MPNKYLNEKAEKILEENAAPGQTPSGVIIELAQKADAKIPEKQKVEAVA